MTTTTMPPARTRRKGFIRILLLATWLPLAACAVGPPPEQVREELSCWYREQFPEAEVVRIDPSGGRRVTPEHALVPVCVTFRTPQGREEKEFEVWYQEDSSGGGWKPFLDFGLLSRIDALPENQQLLVPYGRMK